MASGLALPKPGDVIVGRYVIEAPLGEGGMAVVYRARHRNTGKLCALKFIHRHLVSRDSLVDQFLKEARIAGKIGSHPHIVDIFDADVDADHELPFIAMELLEGETLSEHIQRNGPIPWPVAAEMLEQLADALDEAHRAGVIHRDLKLSNIFIDQRRRRRMNVKVLDFGIAKILEGIGGTTATQVGTPAYSAPEQLGAGVRSLAKERGYTISAGVSASTDVWALAFVVYSMLTGHPAEQYWNVGQLGDLLIKVALEPREPPSKRAVNRKLPAGFDEWFDRCTRHHAEDRFPSPGAAVQALLPLLGGTVKDITEADTLRPTPTPRDTPQPPEPRLSEPQLVEARPSGSSSPSLERVSSRGIPAPRASGRGLPVDTPTELLSDDNLLVLPQAVAPPTPVQHVLPPVSTSKPDPVLLAWRRVRAGVSRLPPGAKEAIIASGAAALGLIIVVGGVAMFGSEDPEPARSLGDAMPVVSVPEPSAEASASSSVVVPPPSASARPSSSPGEGPPGEGPPGEPAKTPSSSVRLAPTSAPGTPRPAPKKRPGDWGL